MRTPDLPARGHGEDYPLLREPRHRLGRVAVRARREEDRACRRHRDLPAIGVAGTVVAPLSRPGELLRLGLDAGARASAPAQHRAAAGDLRPCRLGRSLLDHRRNRRRGDLGYPRPGGRARTLVPLARAQGAAARHRRLWRRGRNRRRHRRQDRRDAMKRFAELLDRLSYEASRNNKLRLMTDYFRSAPDFDRGYALAALTGTLTFQHAKPNVLRTLIEQRTDPVLFGLSRDYVGDTSETIALMWPADPAHRPNAALSLSDAVDTI